MLQEEFSLRDQVPERRTATALGVDQLDGFHQVIRTENIEASALSNHLLGLERDIWK